MADEAKRKLVVIITHPETNDRATIGLTIANAALSHGMEAAIFLTSDGIDAARHGAADLAHFRPFQPLAGLIDSFVAQGGQLWCCGSCCQHRGLKLEDVGDKVKVTGVAALVAWLAEGAQAISL